MKPIGKTTPFQYNVIFTASADGVFRENHIMWRPLRKRGDFDFWFPDHARPLRRLKRRARKRHRH